VFYKLNLPFRGALVGYFSPVTAHLIKNIRCLHGILQVAVSPQFTPKNAYTNNA
jgi:hypothetical protein